jgi:LuxR family maltose regulon positive regulatory protein
VAKTARQATLQRTVEDPGLDDSGRVRPRHVESVVITKLHPPTRRDHLVHRSRPLERLGTQPLAKLTLVEAPAGWGKTTLVAEWLDRSATSPLFAWVAVDAGDNDPTRFWTYVVEAIRRTLPGRVERCLELLRLPGVGVVDLVLPELINGTVDAPPVVLVLDDYHLLVNPDIHRQVTFLLEHLPPSLRLALTSRCDVPLPIARLRALGELTEVRAADLRFSRDEARTLLNDLHHLGLDDADVARLTERTEGWVAGLYLAALSLRDGRDARGFVAAFSGNERHVVDYLGEEVLDGLSSELRAFLVRTSVLDRLCGALCDAVVDGTDSDELLERIERSNLFLAPLDSQREWYRYHHLFGELLRHELVRTHPEIVSTLHRRAAVWYRDRGHIVDAVHHAIAAGDVDDASTVIARHWNDYVNGGRVETVDGWLSALPPEVVSADPRLCLARAGTSLTLGRRDDVDPWLDRAEVRATVVTDPARETSIESEAAIYRAVHRYMAGDCAAAATAAQRAVALEREGTSPWRAMASAALGRTLYWQGRWDEARAALEDAVEHAQPPRNNLSVIGALGYLADIHAGLGQFDSARRIAASAVALSSEHGLSEHWVTMIALVAMGRILRHEGRLDDSETALTRAMTLARRGAGAVETAHSLIALGGLRAERGDAEGAKVLLREARSLIASCPEPGILPDVLARTSAILRSVPGAAVVRGQSSALSDRELVVLRLLSGTLSRREIADVLHVSVNTIKTQIGAVYSKLGVSCRSDAVARARASGLL